jgi:DNA-directed RNA polymerase specialized sigma24 family protein
MAQHSGDTTWAAVGGRDRGFPTTHWSKIDGAKSSDEACRHSAIADVLMTYWKPVYDFLWCEGYSKEAAADLTQEFFCEVVLARGLIQKADRERGRFRTFLLRALRNYAVSVRRAEWTKRRMPEGGLVSLESIDFSNVSKPAVRSTPEKAYSYAWAANLLDQVLRVVEAESRAKGCTTHWEVFEKLVLGPILHNKKAPSRAALCKQYKIPNEQQVSNMIVSVKRRFTRVLRRHLRLLVPAESDVDEEIRELITTLSEPM